MQEKELPQKIADPLPGNPGIVLGIYCASGDCYITLDPGVDWSAGRTDSFIPARTAVKYVGNPITQAAWVTANNTVYLPGGTRNGATLYMYCPFLGTNIVRVESGYGVQLNIGEYNQSMSPLYVNITVEIVG